MVPGGQLVSEPPEQSQIQLAKAIGIEQPSLVRTLDQLEEKGLITRSTCANDRRAKRIKLTQQAEPIIEQVETVIDETRDDILSGISQYNLLNLTPALYAAILIIAASTIATGILAWRTRYRYGWVHGIISLAFCLIQPIL